MYFIMLSVCTVDILLQADSFSQIFNFCFFFYKEKRDLEMRVLGKQNKNSWLTMCTSFSRFGYAMEYTRTIRILIKIIRNDIMLQRWQFQSFTRVLLCFAPSLRS